MRSRSSLALFAVLAFTACSDPAPVSTLDAGRDAEALDAPIDRPAPDAGDTPTDTPTDTPSVDAPPTDAPGDAPADAPADVPVDLLADATLDTPADARLDAPADAAMDAPADAPVDAPTDARADVLLDSGVDVAPDAPADVAMDRTTPTDATPTDTTPPPDVTPTDTGSAADVAAPVDSGRAPCGAPGQGCCSMRACNAGSECVASVCRAYTRATDECAQSADCTLGQVCSGPDACSGHGCWLCAPARGTGALGASCTTSDNCATGVCRFGRCTIPCTAGATGDAECRARVGANQVCSELTYSAMSGASLVTLGVCVRGCARNADCLSPEVCIPLLNYLNDRYDFVCSAIPAGSPRTGAAGAPCSDGTTCLSGLCIPPSSGTGAGACTAFCTTAADCPTAAPVCGDLPLLRPGGGVQVTRGCQVR